MKDCEGVLLTVLTLYKEVKTMKDVTLKQGSRVNLNVKPKVVIRFMISTTLGGNMTQ